MAFSKTWNEASPTATDPADEIHLDIQTDKIATRERLESFMGISDFSSRDPMSADSIRMGGANPKIRGGSASLVITASDGTTPILTIDTTNSNLLTNKINRGVISISGAAIGFDIFQPVVGVMYHLLIFGKDAASPSNGFIDEITCMNPAAAVTKTVLHSTTLVGAPGARTYSDNAGKLKIAVASGATWYLDIAATFNTTT